MILSYVFEVHSTAMIIIITECKVRNKEGPQEDLTGLVERVAHIYVTEMAWETHGSMSSGPCLPGVDCCP